MDSSLFYLKPTEVKVHTDLPRFRQEMGDVKSLAISIHEKGQLQPIVVNEDNCLVCGGRRLAACLLLNQEVLCRRLQETDPLALRELELLENLERKDFTPAEKALAIEEIHKLKREQLKSQGLPEEDWGVRKTADFLGVSKSTVANALNIADVVKDNPELAKLKTEVAITKATKNIKRVAACMDALTLHTQTIKEKGTSFELVNDDFINHIKTIPDASIDLLFTDPIYGIDYDQIVRGCGGAVGGVVSSGNKYSDKVSDALAYFQILAEQSSRICKNTAQAYVFLAPDHFWTVKTLFLAAGWEVYPKPLIWIKRGSGQTNQPHRWPASCYEMILYGRMPQASLVKEGMPDWIECPTLNSSDKLYPTEKPQPLLKNLLQRSALPGYRLYDPFMGSGALIEAGYNEGLFCIGVDIAPDAYAIAVSRMAKILAARDVQQTFTDEELTYDYREEEEGGGGGEQ